MAKKRVTKAPVDTTPRAYTVEEMREKFLDHLQGICNYWISTPLDRPEFQDRLKEQGEVRYRMEGMLFSMLVLFDGGSGFMPAFDITPSPHETDAEFHRERGENWWDTKVINDTQLHEIYSSRERTGKSG